MPYRNKAFEINIKIFLKCVYTITFITIISSSDQITSTNKIPIHRQMLKCVNNVLRRYFNPAWPIILSLPDESEKESAPNIINLMPRSDGSHLNKMLIQTFMVEYDWPLVILGPFESTETNIKVPRQENFLIMTQDIKDFDEMEEQITDLRESQFWNPKGNFLVLVSNSEVSLSFQESFAYDVLHKIWYDYKILKSILVIHDMKSTPIIQTYAWSAEQTATECLKFQRIVLLDTCNYNFTSNEVSENKVPTNFKNCPIRIMTPVRDYYTITNEENQTSYQFDEPELTILDLVIQKLNLFPVVTPPFPKDSDFYTNTVATISDVFFGKVDLGIGYLFLDTEPTKFTDPSLPYHFSYGYRWYVPCGRKLSRVTTMSRIFSATFLLALIVSIALAVFIMKLLASDRNRNLKLSIYKSSIMCLYCIWAVLLGVSVPAQPESLKLRTFFTFLIWFSLAINMVFQTIFTSYMTDPGLENTIQDYTELINSNMELGCEYNLDIAFNRSVDERDTEVRNRHINCTDPIYCLSRVEKTKNFAYLAKQHDAKWYSKNRKNPLMCILPDGHITFLLSMYFTKGSYFRDPFNAVICTLMEAGLVTKIFSDHLDAKAVGHKETAWVKRTVNISLDENSGDDEYITLSLFHMEISFYFIFVGYIVSFAVFIVESLLNVINLRH
ncbi:Ionotropic receptor 667 [Blattella germanica]|nr:Ionotropic receptor 667 [Blattella germanica]